MAKSARRSFDHRQFCDEHNLGHVVSNDSGVVTERDPDTVRGADVAFYSYGRVPPGPFPRGYLAVAPELVFEVRSPTIAGAYPGQGWRVSGAPVSTVVSRPRSR